MDTKTLKIAELNKKLEGLIKKTYKFLDETGNASLKAQLQKEILEIQDRETIRIAFVGQYNSGKSTIISAITGNKDIEIDSNVATDVVAEYKWENIVLVDTPGILAGKNEQHDERTKEELAKCDLIVYVLTSQLFDDIIFENFIDLAYNQNLNDKMIIAINKMSMEAGEFHTLTENYKESIVNVFNERGYHFNFDVVFLDALDYIDGKESNDDEFIKLSNFETFVATLNRFAEEKGQIKKVFDTPIRALKAKVADIAISQIDPALKDLLDQHSNRVKKYKREIQREIQSLTLDFKTEINREGLAVSNQIGVLGGDEYTNEVELFEASIKKNLLELSKQIEDSIKENYDELMQSLEEYGAKDSISLFEQNLMSKIQLESTPAETKNNLERQKTIVTFISKGTKSVGEKVANTNVHALVLNTGHKFGYKFRPWEAVKKAGKITKGVAIAIPIITTGIELYMAEKERREEEKRLEAIKAAKQQFMAETRKITEGITTEIDEELADVVFNAYNEKLEQINQIKHELAKSENKNKTQLSLIKELESEYVEFIEIIK